MTVIHVGGTQQWIINELIEKAKAKAVQEDTYNYISAIVKGDDVIVFERSTTKDSPREKRVYRAPFYFYVADDDGEDETIFGNKCTKFEFASQKAYFGERKRLMESDFELFESDITADLRILSTEYYNVPAPKLHISFYDIEVDYDEERGFSSPKDPYAPISSITICHKWKNEYVVLVVPPKGWQGTEDGLITECDTISPLPSNIRFIICTNEKELLLNFLLEIEDSDILSGWNSDFFDMPYIVGRIEKVLGTKMLKKLCFDECEPPVIREVEITGGKTNITVDLNGRVSLDYLRLYKKYEPGERASFKLSAIADAVVPEMPKLSFSGSLHDLYRNNFSLFVRYNIRDTEILSAFEDRLGYVEIANLNVHISTAQFRHVLGSLKLHDLATINYCHHTLNLIVPNTKQPDMANDRQIEGAYVLEPKIGLHSWVGSIDITSLYPSAIRAINISPETLRGQFVDDVRAAEEIAKGSMVELDLRLESNGQILTKTAADWRDYLKQRKWAISGYGTVFDQTNQGIIPQVLADWFAMRMHYQALKKKAEKEGDKEQAAYYDRLQYVFKIKLNSYYGALSNLYFRFYDIRMGESTTGTGRSVLRYQCGKANELLTGIHDYLGDAVVYGDTDSCYFKTYTDNLTDARKIADRVAKLINDSFPEFMRETFLCNPGFDDKVKAAREIITDRGIFVEKKRYILHIVDKEGKTKDDLKVMGLDTKKTSMPAAVAKQLNMFIERFLKGEDWNTIAETIVDYKDQLRAAEDVLELGLPKGCNNVEKYTTDYERDEKARLPGHVAAAIFYNICLEQYHDKVSPPITSGMKIKVFYLTDTYVNGKFKAIAIPTDIDTIPKWFVDNFKIDYDAQIERLVDNPLENILHAIGKNSPTRQDMLVDSLFSF